MGFRIAVDVDGVLADQVPPILLRLNAKYGIELSKEDITDWEYRIMDTKIDIEIEKALLDQRFVLEMSVIDGSKESMLYLWRNHVVMIATSRPKETESATLKWLSLNFKSHEYCNTRGRTKKLLNADILIDDNIQNIKDFASGDGIGLLFSQPWNGNLTSLKGLMDKGKVYCCNGWTDVLDVINRLNSAASAKS